MEILLKPHITEKTSRDSEDKGVYTFIVHKKANKIQIKEAVEEMYGVTVEAVRTANVASKSRQRFTKAGILKGRSNAYKKAILQLAEGDIIDFYSNI